MVTRTEALVHSSIGDVPLDDDGSPVGAVRMDPNRSYTGVAELLASVINRGDTDAWNQITNRIDYTYDNLRHAMRSLDGVTGYAARVREEAKAGKTVLFKPNLVSPCAIDLFTHGRNSAYTACTSWALVAALMRWFHDELGVSYHQMAVGEAATATPCIAGFYSITLGKTITPEAVIEGRHGDSYGGWGFYFARRYLAERHDPSHRDDPMIGYDDSVAGRYVPPGAGDRLSVYDLNYVDDTPSRGRDIALPDGENFKTVFLHKAIVGGDPNDPEDRKRYPGCVLVNVPKLKVHLNELITNAFKNLGIGLWPLAAHSHGENGSDWLYGTPNLEIPGMKSRIPHEVWWPEIASDRSGIAKRDASGRYLVRKTAGMWGTMCDLVKALDKQDMLIINVVDAIEITNNMHTGSPAAVTVPEGWVFASLDAVAADLVSARYMFKTVPMADARRIQSEERLPSDFLRAVTIPQSDGSNIVSRMGFDSPVSRYGFFDYAAERGLGRNKAFVVGYDAVEGKRLASIQGHLGRLGGGSFEEAITDTLYSEINKPLWDMQKTVLAYAGANDQLTGSRYKDEFLEAFDEDGDGVIGYVETGRKGRSTVWMCSIGYSTATIGSNEYGLLIGPFYSAANELRFSNAAWNAEDHDVLKEWYESAATTTAMRMSAAPAEQPDPLFPGMTWGNGKWPSLQYVRRCIVDQAIYGPAFPQLIVGSSLYGLAMQYADKVHAGGAYTGGKSQLTADPMAVTKYIAAVQGGAAPLPFVLYIPTGCGKSRGIDLPNLEETEDRSKMFTAVFADGKEVWSA